MILSQIPNDFETRSPLLGAEQQNTEILFPVPSKNWLTFFRPQLWGYFLNANFGLAWQWNFRFLGVFLGVFLLSLLVTHHHFYISAMLGTIAALSPFAQFWSFDKEPLTLFAGLSLWCAHKVMTFPAHRSLWSVGLFYSLGAFVFSYIYPPLQVPLTWMIVFLAFGLFWKRPLKEFLNPHVLLPFLGVGVFIFVWASTNREDLLTMMNTAYPGKRNEMGGDLELPRLFSNTLILFNRQIDWSFAGNICEAASYVFLFPVTALWIALESSKQKLTALSISLITFAAFILVWMFLGLPEPLNQLTLLNKVPARRAMQALGIADLLLLGYFLRSNKPDVSQSQYKSGLLLIAAGVYYVYLGTGYLEY